MLNSVYVVSKSAQPNVKLSDILSGNAAIDDCGIVWLAESDGFIVFEDDECSFVVGRNRDTVVTPCTIDIRVEVSYET